MTEQKTHNRMTRDKNKGKIQETTLEATVTEAKRTPVDREGGGEGNDVRDTKQQGMGSGPISRGDRGRMQSGRAMEGAEAEGMETDLKVQGREGTMTEEEETSRVGGRHGRFRTGGGSRDRDRLKRNSSNAQT